MSNITGRSYKVPAGYSGKSSPTNASFEKAYLAFVKNNKDTRKLGNIQVWIPELSGDPTDSSKWFTVRYMSPFAGATPINDGGASFKGKTTSDFTQQSYGWWGIVPDINNEVMVMFINGDPGRGVLMGCFYQEYMNHMIPGIASDPSFQSDPDIPQNPPVLEYNKWGPTGSANKLTADADPSTTPDPIRPRFDDLHNGLSIEGLYSDTIRGPSDASARHGPDDGTPYKVYGFLSPHGHQNYISDDNNNEYIRFRTKGGTQILINDTHGLVYINSKKGNSWIEISDAGIDVYSSKSVSIRGQGDINIRGDKDVNIEAGNSMNLHTVKGPIRIHAEGGDISGISDKNISLNATMNGTFSSGKALKLTAGSTGTLSASATMSVSGALVLVNSSATSVAGGLVPDMASMAGPLADAGGAMSEVSGAMAEAQAAVSEVQNTVGAVVAEAQAALPAVESMGLQAVEAACPEIAAALPVAELVNQGLEAAGVQIPLVSSTLNDVAGNLSGIPGLGSIPGLSGEIGNLGGIAQGLTGSMGDLSGVQGMLGGVTTNITSGLGNLQGLSSTLTNATSNLNIDGLSGITSTLGNQSNILGNASSLLNTQSLNLNGMSNISSNFSGIGDLTGPNAITNLTTSLNNNPIQNLNIDQTNLSPGVMNLAKTSMDTSSLSTYTGSLSTSMDNMSNTLTGMSGNISIPAGNLTQASSILSSSGQGLGNASSVFSGFQTNVTNAGNGMVSNASTILDAGNQMADHATTLSATKANLDTHSTGIDNAISNLTNINATQNNPVIAEQITKLQSAKETLNSTSSVIGQASNNAQQAANTLTKNAGTFTQMGQALPAAAAAIGKHSDTLQTAQDTVTKQSQAVAAQSIKVDSANTTVGDAAKTAKQQAKAAAKIKNSLPAAGGIPDTILNPPTYPQTTITTVLSRMPAHEPWPLHNTDTPSGGQGIRTAGGVPMSLVPGDAGSSSANSSEGLTPGTASVFKGDPTMLGSISAKYESNGNPGAIGNDSTGGYSYGSYQIATKTGTFDDFLDFLEDNYPDQFNALDAAGGSDAATAGTPQFKDAFKNLAKNDPKFGIAQHEFIKSTHYDPACNTIAGTLNFDVNTRSKAMMDAIWSCSVQNGPSGCCRVLKNALNGQDPNSMTDPQIIQLFYAERGKTDKYFPHSTSGVQASVRNRMVNESRDAIAEYNTAQTTAVA